MKNTDISDAQIHSYLLGFLDEELAEQVDEKMVTDLAFLDHVEEIEQGIIEEYIEGSLSPDDLRAMERYFLRLPAGQLKLRNARLIIRHLAKPSVGATAGAPGTVLPFPSKQQPVTFTPRFRIYAGIAALVIFTVSLSYFLQPHRDLGVSVKHDGPQIERGQQHSSNPGPLPQAAPRPPAPALPAPGPQLQAAILPPASSTVAINLLEPGLRRGISDLPEAKMSAATTTLHIEVALTSPAPGKYDVLLEQAEKVVWSLNDRYAATVSGGAVLKLDIPAKSLSNGTCQLTVFPQGTHKVSYWFLVKKSE